MWLREIAPQADFRLLPRLPKSAKTAPSLASFR
jgi:hypothetical protein